MITIRPEIPSDITAREMLLDRAFGLNRAARTAERLREGRLPAEHLALVADDGAAVIGTVRLWHVRAGTGRPALLLGPIAIDASRRSLGIGTALMRQAIGTAGALGHQAILLVGDAPYYERFGFSAAHTAALRMPGPYEPARLLGLALAPGALDGARGLIRAAGPRLPLAAARTRKTRVAGLSHAA